MRALASLVQLALILAVLASPSLAAPPTELEPAVVEYQAYLYSVSGFYEIPWSASRFDRLERLQREWQDRLKGLEFERLDPHGRVDYLLLRPKLASELDDQALAQRLAEMAELIPLRDEIQALEEARWRLEPIDAESAGATLAKLPDRVKQLRDRLEQEDQLMAMRGNNRHFYPRESMNERFHSGIQAQSASKLVALIEVLSPTNKGEGPGRHRIKPSKRRPWPASVTSSRSICSARDYMFMRSRSGAWRS